MVTPVLERPPIPQGAAPPVLQVRRGQVIVGVLLFALLVVVALAAFGAPVLQLLGTGILVLSLAVVVLLAGGAGVIAVLVTAMRRERGQLLPWLWRASRFAVTVAVLLVGLGVAAVESQWHASTAQILGANGQPLPGSIATLEQITVNGSRQWITIRGKNAHNPVLLFLMGGPGAGGFLDQGFLAPLEDHFVVVNWDQPNTGKSYGAVPREQLTPQRYVADAYALTQLLRALPPGQDLCARLLVGQHRRDYARAAVSRPVRRLRRAWPDGQHDRE